MKVIPETRSNFDIYAFFPTILFSPYLLIFHIFFL